jgi:hypothetical protein
MVRAWKEETDRMDREVRRISRRIPNLPIVNLKRIPQRIRTPILIRRNLPRIIPREVLLGVSHRHKTISPLSPQRVIGISKNSREIRLKKIE